MRGWKSGWWLIRSWIFVLVSLSGWADHPPQLALASSGDQSFPTTFKWCVSTSAHQIEGNNSNTDWWSWEQVPGKIRNGDRSGLACDHWNRVDEDIALMKTLHVQQYRFSVEWARIQPAPDRWDAQALEHYRQEVLSLRRNGIEPLVTLHHFTFPRWVAKRGGWEWDGLPQAFADYTQVVYQALGEGVRDWVTINEPTVMLVAGYIAGVTPPGKKGSFSEIVRPMKGMLRSHAAAYRALHRLAQTAGRGQVRVGIAHHLRVFDPDSEYNPLDRMAANAFDRVFNGSFGQALETGRLEMKIPFLLDVNDSMPDVAGTQDFIGVNYYSRDRVSFSMNPPHFVDLLVDERSEVTDLGWEIYPEGMYRTLKQVARMFPGRPVLITENGIADASDRKRIAFLRSHLSAVKRAIAEGVPVENYCHWSLLDNFEWVEGFAPRFGLYAVDYPTQRRIPRPSAAFFAEITGKNRLP